MIFPNRFKLYWWSILVLIVSIYLVLRYPQLISGQTNSSDSIAFIIWFCLVLTPLFSEINIYGFSLKQEVRELKENVREQLESIRVEIKNSVDIQNQTQVNPQFLINPPADSQLPKLEERILATLKEAMQRYDVKPDITKSKDLEVNANVEYLFSARYNLEKEVRRIAKGRLVDTLKGRVLPFHQIVRDLTAMQLIEPQVATALQEAYRVCSPAVHGDDFDVSEAQVEFVRNVVPGLIATLKAIA